MWTDARDSFTSSELHILMKILKESSINRIGEGKRLMYILDNAIDIIRKIGKN